MKRVICLLLTVLTAAVALTSCRDGKTPEVVVTTPVSPVAGSHPSSIDNGQLVFTAYRNGYSVRKHPDVDSYPSCLVVPSIYNGKPVVKIDGGGFYDCTGVTEVVLPNSVTEIDFSGLPKDTHKLTCRADVDFGGYEAYPIEELCLTAGASGTSGCWLRMESLIRLTLGSGITVIENDGFADCSNLMKIAFPASLTTIGECAFARCRFMRDLTLPEGLTEIGVAAFEYCMGLESVQLPDSLVILGEFAFGECMNLRRVYIGKGLSQIGHGAFADCPYLSHFAVHPGNTFFYAEDGILYDKSGNRI